MKKFIAISTFLILFSFLNIYSVSAQEYFFDTYGVNEGIPDSKVKSIIQSEDGYIWLGTASGLSRFDGETFTNYTVEDGVAPLGVSKIFIDSHKNIWIGHFAGGVSIYRNNKFETIRLDSVSGDITDFVEDSINNIWISTSESGVYMINESSGDLKVEKHLKASDGLGNIVFSMSNTKSLGMLFVTRYGVKFFNSKVGKYEFVNEQFFAWPQYFNIIQVFEDNANGLWVGTFNGGLYYYKDINTKPVIFDKRDGLAMNWVSDIYQSRDSAIWVATFGGGITKFKNSIIQNYSIENGLPDNKINTIYQDYEGNILLGTYSKGLSVFKGEGFVNYKKFISDKPLQVNAIVKTSKNRSWFGTNSGLFKYTTNSDKTEIEAIYKDDIDLQSNDIRSLKVDEDKNIWIGTFGGGLSMYNTSKKKMEYPYYPNMLLLQANRVPNVTALEIDKEGNVWVGSNGGLVYFEPKNNKSDILSQGNGLQNNDISSLYCDDKGTLWVGHQDKGISRIDGSNISKFNIGMQFTPTCFFGDENNLWVGTQGRGLFHLQGKKIVEHYSLDNGLLSNLITALSSDEEGSIIVGTNRGLNKINLRDSIIGAFGPKEGFIGVEVKSNAFYKDNANRIYCGTALGLTLIQTDKLVINHDPAIININRLRVNLEDSPLIQGAKFQYNSNSILIDYKAICISDASKVEYKVRLLGAETEWQPITKQTYANFPALPAGDYVFEVKARNNSGIWNSQPQQFKFTILPPFWQTIWFYTIVIVVLIVSVVLFVKIRERQLLKEKAELEAKVKERTVEVRKKNELLAKKNKDITDSINYARRIQRAIMPPQTKMDELLESSFIFYRPKDIVSGDFHWNTFHNNRLIVTAADCTGHGVPGAFMSMISISSLNKVVKEKQITDPARILDNMRFDIINDLKQSGDMQTKDGLDIALLSIDTENKIVDFAGAYNSMYVVKAKAIDDSKLNYDFNYSIFNDRLLEVKADRMPIGVSDRMNVNFTTKRLQMEAGDRVYITTDGYIDQFGGEKGKKFMSKRFKNLLLELSYLDSENALQKLDKQFVDWRGVHEQIDDVLVIGICF
jgi:ligand-binding sensor domain-containing protein/serine phosphatase RsbU (regulator of sigma subunit)